MQLSKKEQTSTTVQEIQQVVKKKVTVTDKFIGFGTGPVTIAKRLDLGECFNSSTDRNYNEMDKWLLDRLYFSMRSDGGVNFVAALDPTTNTLTMLPMSIGKVTSIHPEAIELLSDDFRNKLFEFAEPDDNWFPTKPEDMAVLRNKFPICFLKGADFVGHYGEVYERKTQVEDEEPQFGYRLENAVLRLYSHGDLIKPADSFANNITCYRTPNNSFNMAKLKIYSTNKNEVALKHLNLDKWCEKGDWSLWKEFFNNRNVEGEKLDLLMGLIWAIFDESYKTRQMIYLYDPHGYSGKSVMLDALSEPFREIDAYAVYTESSSNNFTNERLWDKRFLAIPDNKNPKIVKYGRFHQLTGDDAIDVDIKNRRGFTVKPEAKLFGVGNILPEVDLDAKHETSRIAIFCLKLNQEAYKQINHEDGTTGDATFGFRLKQQLKAFLYECREVAKRINPNKCDFNVGILEEDVKKCAEPKLEYFNDFIMNNIVFDDKSRTTLAELTNTYESYKKVNMNLWTGLGKPELSDFKEHLQKLKNIEFKHLAKGMTFIGMKLVNAPQQTQPQQTGTSEIDQQAVDLLNKMTNRSLKGVNEVC